MDAKDSLEETLPWDHFSKWIHCIAVVTFDIEIGQAIEKVYPNHINLTEKEKTNICYLAFPDSNSGCMGDTNFHFRTRLCSSRRKTMAVYKEYNRNCLIAHQVDSLYFYGFAYFRQVKDRNARRGYFQKSLVLLTRLPFISLYSQIVTIIAPQYFDFGSKCIEDACNEIDTWRPPIPGSSLNLTLMGIVINVQIPHRNDKISYTDNNNSSPPPSVSSSSSSTTSLTSIPVPSTSTLTVKNVSDNNGLSCGLKSSLSSPTLNNLSTSSTHTNDDANNCMNQMLVLNLPSLYEVDLFRCFLPIVSHIQLLWELVLTCEPIIVMASTPDVCSSIVQALVSTIWPLKFASDYRPFFTIHDSEFKEYTAKAQAPPPVILGVTNPFFGKTLQHWPHIIRLGDYTTGSTDIGRIAALNNVKMHAGTTMKTLDCKPGLYSKYKAYLNKDRNILKKILKGIESRRPAEVQTVLLRRYFTELTQSFLIPLERYLASLMPLQKIISPFKATPKFPPFNQDDFLRTLEQFGPNLTTGIRGDWSNLYRRFFRSPNFQLWYEIRCKEVNSTLQALHIKAMTEVNLLLWIENKAEVEIVDLILRLKEKLNLINNDHLPVKQETKARLEQLLHDIIKTLPNDLQQILSK